MTSDTLIRRCIFRPFRKDMGPVFTLSVYEGDLRHGRHYLAYTLSMRDEGKRTLLFEGDDFSPGFGTCEDSDACMRALMGFLTLKPGDTDRDYFDAYTPAQLDYCTRWAESLDSAVSDRFGED